MIGPESDKDIIYLIRLRLAKCSVDILSWKLSPSGFHITLSHVLPHVVVVTSVIVALVLDVVPSILAVVPLPLVVVEAAHFVLLAFSVTYNNTAMLFFAGMDWKYVCICLIIPWPECSCLCWWRCL